MKMPVYERKNRACIGIGYEMESTGYDSRRADRHLYQFIGYKEQ